MVRTFTKEFIINNKGCYTYEQVNKLSFINKELITIDDIVNSEMPLKDKYWWLFKKCDLSLEDKQQLAIQLVEIVLEIYESKYPNNKAPREAIQAAKDYLAGVIDIDVLRIKRNAAYAAYVAADAAAYAAYVAADDAATYAAYAAADDDAYVAAADAAYAAYAATVATVAADAAADAAAYVVYAKVSRQDLIDKMFDLLKNKIMEKLKEEGDYIDRYRSDLKTTNKRRSKEVWWITAFLLGMIVLAMFLTSCKKKETKPTPTPHIEPVVEERMWLLGGDWKCVGGDTMFTQILHMHYCCEANQGTSAVYYMSYPVWWHKTNLTVPYFYNNDSIRLDNGIIGGGAKTVLFTKIK